MPIGLPVSRVVSVSISLTPLPAQLENFQTFLVVGDSNVIDTNERLRSYGTITEVATDFGTTAPEYLAALLYFSQQPEPTQLYIGRWAHTATAGLLRCGFLSGAEQVMANWTSITTGSFHVSIDSVANDITGLNFSAATNLNAVAAAIQTAIRAIGTGGYTLATCVWVAAYSNFVITSGTTGATSTVSFLTAAATGADISAQLKGTAATADYAVDGIAAETAVAAVVALDTLPTQWYGLQFAAGTNNADITDADHLAIAAYVEASGTATGNPHLYAVTTADTTALISNDLTDIGAELMAAGYERTFVQWSSTNAYASASMFGRLLTVDFQGSSTTLTLMWKQEPGVTRELLNSTQANSLDQKRYNYYVQFNNNTSIIVGGRCAGPAFVDEIFNMDGLANEIQTDVYNLMITTLKVPQTDPGVHEITTVIEASCQIFVRNGFLAPGVWQSGGFGPLNYGDTLSKGYFVYAPPVAIQPVADRGARISPTIQVAAKEAGAIHDVVINALVNR